MAKSQRIGMPLLSAGQALKELTHNEALILLDAVIFGCCSGPPSNSPPQIPEEGLSYICSAAPSGAWAGHPNGVACWCDSGWRYIPPFDGLQLIDRAGGSTWRYMAGQWSSGIIKGSQFQVNGVKVVGAQQPAISNAMGGSAIDIEARSTLAQVLTTLRNHGLIASAG